MKNHLNIWVVLFLFWILCAGCATTRNHEIFPVTEDPEPNTHIQKTVASSSTHGESRSEFNIPIVVNRDVDRFIRFFQTRNRRYFKRWLARSARYKPLMQKILAENDLPTDLVYLAMIESGFNTQARSYRHAVGPWQFIRGTAKAYDLKMDWWIDERRDPIKSTIAASQYLKDLYDMFDSWFLAAAGYNAGENKIKRAIRRYKSQNFWDLRLGQYLKRETKDYVPKLIAAALIAKSPEKYGFSDISYQEPLSFDTVMVTEPTDLREVAKIVGVNYKALKYLNSELKRWCTPPRMPEYVLRLPSGTKEKFLTHLRNNPRKHKMIFHSHRIKSGETLSHIARRYGTYIQPIMEMNKIKFPKRLRPGQHLIIPVRSRKTSRET